MVPHNRLLAPIPAAGEASHLLKDTGLDGDVYVEMKDKGWEDAVTCPAGTSSATGRP